MKQKMRGTYVLIDWLWNKMSFLKRKRVKFNVDLQVCTLSDVPLVNAVLFAKVRLLEGGTFEDSTERVEVTNHSASWSHRSSFCCRIASDLSSGMLEKCLCRISIRKEQKGGKSYLKLGYVDINLSEFAASGVEGISRSYLLDGYGLNARQDNSKVQVKVAMSHQSADPIFRVPRIAGVSGIEERSLNPADRRAPQGSSEGEDEGYPPADTPTKAINFRQASDAMTESASTAGSSVMGEECGSMSSECRRSNANTLRRLSQDRSSAPRVQSTRIDAGGVIDRMLAESRLSEDVLQDQEGLALYVGKDGAAAIAPSGTGYHKVTIANDMG